MSVDYLNKRLIELFNFRKQVEVQLINLDGHIEEIKYLVSQQSKPVEEKKDGEVIEQPTEQAA